MAHATDDAGLTRVRAPRLARRRRRSRVMAVLGVLTLAGAIGDANAAPAEPKRRAPRVERDPSGRERRSARVRNAASEFDGSAWTPSPFESSTASSAAAPRSDGRRRSAPTLRRGGGCARAACGRRDAAARGVARVARGRARARRLARGASVASAPPRSWMAASTRTDESGVAVGPRRPRGDAACATGSWHRSRAAPRRRPTISAPEEYYAHDAWQLLVACGSGCPARARAGRTRSRRPSTRRSACRCGGRTDALMATLGARRA